MDVDQDTTATTPSNGASVTVTLNGLTLSDKTTGTYAFPSVATGKQHLAVEGDEVTSFVEEAEREPWEGPLAIEAHPTSDGRVLLKGVQASALS